MKKLLLIFLAYFNLSICYDVKLNNQTKYPIDFIISNKQWLCDNARKTVNANSSIVFNFKNEPLPCTRATCISSIQALIKKSNNQVFIFDIDLFKKGAIKAGEWIATGAGAGTSMSSPLSLGYNPELAALTAVVGSITGALGAAYDAMNYQCTDMEITVSGEGDKQSDFKIAYKKK